MRIHATTSMRYACIGRISVIVHHITFEAMMCTEYISMDEHYIHGVVGYKNISSNTLAAEYFANGILKEEQIK